MNRASSPSPRGPSVPIGTPVPQRLARPEENQGSLMKPPREMGVLLIALGISELIPPEPIGMVFVVLGGLVFWPRASEPSTAGSGENYPRRIAGTGSSSIASWLTWRDVIPAPRCPDTVGKAP